MKLIISEYAKRQIHLIFIYHVEVASQNTAKKIVAEFVKASQLLERFQEAGQSDIFMRHHGKEYRRFICGNYKIIYHIAENKVYVSDVFDSRQNPEKQKP